MSHLASIQYDIYQRYTILGAAFDAVFARRAKPYRILDVGSGPESLARMFLDGRFEVASCDVDDFGNPAIVKLRPGRPLPFADAAFDAVVCMDVLEHMPDGARPAFLAQLARVAPGMVVVAFPHSDDGVRHGERLLDQGYLDLWNKHCDFLVEHEEFGLPQPAEAAAALEGAGLATLTAGVSRLEEWLLYSYFDILCLSLFGAGAEKADLNRRFNDGARAGRGPEGHYRALIVAARDAGVLERVEGAIFGAGSGAEGSSPSFAVAVNAFGSSRYIAERMRVKAFQDVYSVVAHDLARLSTSQEGVAALGAVPANVEQLARHLGDIRHSISERAAQETAALAESAKALATSLARQAELHELRMKEARAERDELAARVESLTQEMAARAQEMQRGIDERDAALEAAGAELLQARLAGTDITASNEALSRDLEEARRRGEELAASFEAERKAGQANLQRVQRLLDVQAVASGKMSARLRCERRARLLDIKQLESLSRRS